MADHSLDESETRLRLVNPALALAGWSPAQIAEEVVTGRVGADGTREPGRADYVLHIRSDRGMRPVAVLEVKSESREPDDGVEQAAEYARALSVPHALSTNGREFVSVDLATGAIASRRPLAEFPSPDDLQLDDVELSESVLIRKRRLTDIKIWDEQGQLVENRRLQRLIFALVKRGWSEDRDGRQPLSLRLRTIGGEDEGDIQFAIEFVPPGNDRELPAEDATARLYLFGKMSVAKWLNSRQDHAVERSSPDDASLLYVSDGRYFACEDRDHGTRTDQLPLSRFPTPEEMYSTVKPQPQSKPQPKRLQDLPRSAKPGGGSARTRPSRNTQRSSSRPAKSRGENRSPVPSSNARRQSPREDTRSWRNTNSTRGVAYSFDDRMNLVTEAFTNRGWGRPQTRDQGTGQLVNWRRTSTKQFKLSAKINEREAEIAVVPGVSDAPLRSKHIDQAARLATRDGLPAAFVTNGESYIMKKLLTGFQTGSLPMSLFPDPSELLRELAGRPRNRGSDSVHRKDRVRQEASAFDRPRSFWKRLFG